MQFEPLGKYVVVEIVKPDIGALVLPDANGKVTQGNQIVRIVAVGEGRLMQGGERVPLGLDVGDEVVVSPEAQFMQPNKLCYPGMEFHILSADHIIAKVSGRGQPVARRIERAAVTH